MYDYDLTGKELESCITFIYSGNYVKANFCLDKFLKKYPYHYFALDKKGQSLSLMGKFSESLKTLDITLSVLFCLKDSFPFETYSHSLGENLNNRGKTLAKLGKSQESIKTLTKQIILHPDDYDSMNGIAVMYARQKKYSLALKYVDMAISKSPNDINGLSLKEAFIKKFPNIRSKNYVDEYIPNTTNPLHAEFFKELNINLIPCKKFMTLF